MSNNILVNTIYVRDWVYKKKVFNSSFSVHVLPQGIEKQFCLIPDYNLSNWLLSVGSLSRRKGYEYSIKAIKLLIEKYPNLQYKIIGFNSDMKYLEELRVLIAKLGLENNISLLPNLDKQEILDYLAKGNIFLLHSEEESQGIVFCEAMAAGKPIVATSVGGVPFVVKHKDNGFLSEYGDIKTFSEHIDLLLCDVKLRNTMSKRNRAKGLEYTWAQITTEVLSIYNNILNFHRPIVNKTSKVLLSSIN